MKRRPSVYTMAVARPVGVDVRCCMTNRIVRTFHIQVLGRYGVIAGVMFAPLLLLALPDWRLLAALLAVLLFWYLVLRSLGTVVIASDGIVLYRVNRSRWHDLEEARAKPFLGLPYVYVRRANGRSWWIPLYLTDIQGFKSAVVTCAPAGNPLRSYVESNI